MSELADVMYRDPFERPERVETTGTPAGIALGVLFKEHGWDRNVMAMLVNRVDVPMNVMGSSKGRCAVCQREVWLSPSSRRETDPTVKICLVCIAHAYRRAKAADAYEKTATQTLLSEK